VAAAEIPSILLTEIPGIIEKGRTWRVEHIGTTAHAAGHFKREDVQSIVKIGPETPGTNRLLKISVCARR